MASTWEEGGGMDMSGLHYQLPNDEPSDEITVPTPLRFRGYRHRLLLAS